MRKLLPFVWIYITVFSISLLPELQAQQIEDADVQFELQAYELAIESYQSILEEDGENTHALLHLAKSYEGTNDLINAARYYDKLLALDYAMHDADKIAYGKVLKSLGLYDKAKEMFRSCLDENYLGMGKALIRSCDFAETIMKTDDMYEVFLYNGSTDLDDFAPSLWNDQLVFSSFESESEEAAENENALLQSKLNQLYIGDKNRRTKKDDVQAMGSAFFKQEGISSVSFSPDGGKAVFTRNNFKNNIRQIKGNELGLSVYMASVDGEGNFFGEFSLPFNNTEYSVAFACFGEDDKTLYFSSNMHGEKDDFDIYVSKHDGQKWGEAINLGSSVNTAGNEISPSFVEGYLYFASDLLPGMGGYDIFRTQQEGDQWTAALNMGKGINSIADDLYLVRNKESNEYYYASNRLGGKGAFDIYVSIPKSRPEAQDNSLAQSDEIPKEIQLESLRDIHAKNLKYSEAAPVAYEDNLEAPKDLSLEGAYRVAYGEVMYPSSQVFFVQLASLAHSKGKVTQFKKLTDLGNIYRVRKNNVFKIRLGYFMNESEAQSILAQVKRMGFRDAFVVEDVLNLREMELILSNFNFQVEDNYEAPEYSSEYKVRLAAYSNPLYFDTEKVKGLGVIEQWSKGKWTIFLLSGFEDVEEAMQARIKAINRGFTGAELVLDENGILSKVIVN